LAASSLPAFAVILLFAIWKWQAVLLAKSWAKSIQLINKIEVVLTHGHLAQEPFISGADTMIDRVVETIPDAERGFTLIFSSGSFPGHQFRSEWRRPDGSGNWYYAPALEMEGWLCPALLRYFSEAPKELYVQVKSRETK
jgi:hypothetical protein